MRALVFGGSVWLVLGCASVGPRPKTAAGARSLQIMPELSADARLLRGKNRLEQSRYAEAEADLQAALAGGKPALAWLALSELSLLTGRYEAAVQQAQRAAAASAVPADAALAKSRGLRAQGQLEAAQKELEPFAASTSAPALRLELGEILLDRGRRQEAEPLLMTVIEDYNADRIAESDAEGLTLVGRAAQLLRSPKDANDAFDQAERAEGSRLDTLLARADLYLDKYDPGHAEEVLNEAARLSPQNPQVNVLLAELRLAQALDFDEAERLARLALSQNPKLGHAYFVLAGIAIRDQDLALAEQHITNGLRGNPQDLDLLSLRAVVRFLGEDRRGFLAQKREVLRLNPEFTRLYAIIGEFADWEHRYDDIVLEMKEAVALDARDAKAEAQLGLNLIRAGNDPEGIAALSRAFTLDPFNVRVFNTLEMYEKVIARDYVSVTHHGFRIRYRKSEEPILSRYVPDLLDRAWAKMVESYGFTPEIPVGVELYAERENFGIRTSGLPQIAIQGVCFGKTLASMSPGNESFNLGMTLWHELSHVFHIQLSKSRVPRWFTEGLAEYETIIARPEWVRENDQELFQALRAQRLPALGNMSRAFTRAEELEDVGIAYYASSQIMVMLAQRYGHEKLAEMLRQWGEGKSSERVMQSVLGETPASLDRQFKEFAEKKLGRFRSQFMPLRRGGSLVLRREEAEKAPFDLPTQLRLVLALLASGDRDGGSALLERVAKLEPKNADARFLRAELAQDEPPRAIAGLSEMVRSGQDGFAVSSLLGKLSIEAGDVNGARAALTRASAFDPDSATPLYLLADLAQRTSDADGELAALRRLAQLEQHESKVYRRLLELLVERKAWAEAAQVGEAALYADLEGAETHRLFAEALRQTGDEARAIFEYESALLCPAEAAEKLLSHRALAELYAARGRRKEAEIQRKLILELSPAEAAPKRPR